MRKSREYYIPPELSSNEQNVLIALLNGVEQSMAVYRGSWTADWLLSDIHEAKWIVVSRTGNKESREKSNVVQIDWSIELPNGTLLTDDENKIALYAAQEIAFLARSLPEGGIKSAGTLVDFTASLMTLLQWMYLHGPFFEPRRYAFAMLDQRSILDFLSAIAKGGVAEVFDVRVRIFNYIYKSAIGEEPSPDVVENINKISSELAIKLNAWLIDNGYFKGRRTKQKTKFINITKLLSDAGISWLKIRSSRRILHFLRQFELDVNSNILETRRLLAEYSSTSLPKLDEIDQNVFSKSGVESWAKCISRIVRLHRHLPLAIPDPTGICMRTALSVASKNCKPGKHTAWMPLEISLTYTSEALKWIHVYGNDLVETYLKINRRLQNLELLELKGEQARMERDLVVANYNFPESLRPLNISSWSSAIREHGKKQTGFDVMRNRPGLPDVVAVLIGAIIVALGITKPIRDEEIRDLRRNCVEYVEQDGFWLSQHRGKASLEDSPYMNAKPIPSIVARGLILARRLGDDLRSFVDEEGCVFDSDILFFVPYLFSESGIKAGPMTRDLMNQYLNRFCDYTNIKPDSYGRRWYIKTHQLRKSFLITFFWVFKYSSLEACRWIAGHRDAKDVYAYIQANTPGEELSALEASYASAQLWDFDHGKSVDGDNVAELHAAVCRHFGIESLDLVNERELLEWLELEFIEGRFAIEPYSVYSADKSVTTRISYRITPVVN